MQGRKKLGDILVEEKYITTEQLEHALCAKSKHKKIGDTLIENGFITERQLFQALEKQLGVPFIRIEEYQIDEGVLSYITKEFAERNYIVPLQLKNGKLVVAMNDPLNFFAIEDVELFTGLQLEIKLATKEDIEKALNRYYGFDDSLQELVKTAKSEKIHNTGNVLTEEDAPVVKLVNQLLQSAVKQRASDIHIDPHEYEVLVRIRVDGVLQRERILPKELQNMVIARVKILSNMDITETRLPQDGRIRLTSSGEQIDLRVATLPTVFGEKIVIRILNSRAALVGLERLGFSEYHLNVFKKLIYKPNGILLITGPTGSGKSSTLYAGLQELNDERVNIITVEDPVEYQMKGINQIQVNPAVNLTFANGLRSILRQDPNIIMIGEIRDQETADIAIRSSLTGHLVLSTLHTNDAISSVIRLIDMGVEPFLVAASINGIVSQRLVRKICTECKKQIEPNVYEEQLLRRMNKPHEYIYKGDGCTSCNHTGYKGRIAIFEIFVVTDEMRRVIVNNKTIGNLSDMAKENGFITILQDGLDKVASGITTMEEILRITIDD